MVVRRRHRRSLDADIVEADNARKAEEARRRDGRRQLEIEEPPAGDPVMRSGSMDFATHELAAGTRRLGPRLVSPATGIKLGLGVFEVGPPR